MEPFKEIARRLARKKRINLAVTRQQETRIESIELARELRDYRRQELAFNSRPFVLCGLPIRRPPSGALKHTRRNGKFVLEIIAHPEHGLPFGQDRLIPIWAATAAVRQQNRMIIFDSAADILRTFDLPLDGPHYRRLVDGFKRVFGSTIYFGSEQQPGRERLWDYRRFHFFDRLKIWCARGEGDTEFASVPPHSNVIELSETFWREICDHPIPVDLTVARALANNPGAMDFYMWLVWRCFAACGTEAVPLFGHSGLTAQVGVGDYSRERNFRKRVREWLRMVRLYWPECPARVSADGTALIVDGGRAICSRVGKQVRS